MEASKITRQGQITLPKAIRDRLQVKGGDTIVFLEFPDRVEIIKKSSGLSELAGCLKGSTDVHLTIEELNAAIGNAEWKKQ